MNLNNTIWITLTLLLLSVSVNADCEGSITLVDTATRNPGDTLNAISYTTISSQLGVRNWDLWINDPEGNTIALTKKRVTNDTYTLTADLDIDESFLKGEYVIRSKIEVLDPGNLTQTICTETASKAFTINTTRTSYTHGTIQIELLPNYEYYSTTSTQTITFANTSIPMNVTIKNMPIKTTFNFTILNNTNTSVDLSTPGICWNYEEKLKCQNDLLDKDRVIEKYASVVMTRIDNITENCMGLLNEREAEYNATRKEMTQISGKMLNKTEEVNYYVLQLQRTQANLTKAEQEKDSIRLNINALLFFIIGGIVSIGGIGILVNRKIKERKDNT